MVFVLCVCDMELLDVHTYFYSFFSSLSLSFVFNGVGFNKIKKLTLNRLQDGILGEQKPLK
jgi:hypothetical protein